MWRRYLRYFSFFSFVGVRFSVFRLWRGTQGNLIHFGRLCPILALPLLVFFSILSIKDSFAEEDPFFSTVEEVIELLEDLSTPPPENRKSLGIEEIQALEPPSEKAKNSFETKEGLPHPGSVKVSNPVAEFSALDKITGRIENLDIYINETVQFGTLQLTPKVCYSHPDDEGLKLNVFVEIDDITSDKKINRVFSGWMFAESAGLNALDHPVYDVWLKSCKTTSNLSAPVVPGLSSLGQSAPFLVR